MSKVFFYMMLLTAGVLTASTVYAQEATPPEPATEDPAATDDTAADDASDDQAPPLFEGKASVRTNQQARVRSTKVRLRDASWDADSESDHSKVVGHMGVGFFGRPTVVVVPGDPPDEVGAPSLGMRYWLSERLGLEAAVGVGWRTGSNDSGDDPPTRYGINLHAGVPLALAHFKHYKFLVIPEVDFSIGGGTDPNAGAGGQDIDYSSFAIQAGGRVGAEVHFGFIGVPQLSLQGTVGLHLRYERYTASVGNADASSSLFTLSTSTQAEPWNILIGNVAAIYYF